MMPPRSMRYSRRVQSILLTKLSSPFASLLQHVKHMNMDIRMIKSPEGDKIKFIVWHGGRKHLACLRTAKAVFANMIKGVTVGFQYKCRAVYAHFPINMIIGDGGRSVEIRNFLGEKRVRHVEMRKGVTIKDDPAQKDQVLVEGEYTCTRGPYDGSKIAYEVEKYREEKQEQKRAGTQTMRAVAAHGHRGGRPH